MVHVELKDLYRKEYAFLWSLLSFKAGLLNAAGFLIAGSYVSHVTGFGTQIGIAFGHSDYTFGIELLVIPLAFIFGALITSLVLDRNYSNNDVPNYPVVQILITFLIGLIATLFSSGVFDQSSMTGNDVGSLVLVALLCLICGLKNGLTTWASYGKIRTTHLTGLSTDIGLHLPKLFQAEGANSRYPEKKVVTYVRTFTLFCYSIGSCLSAVLIPMIGYKLFHISFAISVILSVISVVHRQHSLYGINKLKPGVFYAHTN